MRFAIIGAAGYIAPRHMKAIIENGGELVAACDVSDSVGVLDQFSRDCRFTTDPEEFFNNLADVDLVTITSPNHLHFSHTRQALEAGCSVVLEKPAAVTGHEADNLVALAGKYPEQRVYPIVQLRYHDEIVALHENFKNASPRDSPAVCEIDYATYRGPWYEKSWKGDEKKSGGLLMNLGVHLFDLCLYVFGPFIRVINAKIAPGEAVGTFRCQHAIVNWRLSSHERQPRRVFSIAGLRIDLSNQLLTLHKQVYSDVMKGWGFSIDDAAQAIRVIDIIKQSG